MRKQFEQANKPSQLAALCTEDLLVYGEPHRSDSSIGFRIVVVVDIGSGGHRFDMLAHAEIERERGATRVRPEIDEDSVRLNLVAKDAGSSFRLFERTAVDRFERCLQLRVRRSPPRH